MSLTCFFVFSFPLSFFPYVFFSLFVFFLCRKSFCRAASAAARGEQAGIPWTYRVDGHIVHTMQEKQERAHRHVRHTVIGDIGFADDTSIIGEIEEAHKAENILIQTMLDWNERVHPDKTESLRMGALEETI